MNRSRSSRRRKSNSVVQASTNPDIEVDDSNSPQLSQMQRITVAGLLASDRRYKVIYLIPHLAQNPLEASLLNWYTPGLHAAAELLMLSARLPADIREPYAPPNAVLLQRLNRNIWPLITPVEIDSLAAVRTIVGTSFQIILTNERDVADQVDQITRLSPDPVLHASTIRGPGRLSMYDLNLPNICRYFREVIEFLVEGQGTSIVGKEMRKTIGNAKQTKPRKHHLALGLHNVVAPNEYALMAFGRKFAREKRISLPHAQLSTVDPQHYVDRICEAADAVFSERMELSEEFPRLRDYRYVLAVASVYWGHYSKWRDVLQKAPKETRNKLKFVYARIVQATTYFDQIDLEKESAPDRLVHYLNSERAKDMKAFTSALTLIATATLAPVLRLEPKLNQIRGELRLLAHCVRSDVHHSFSWKTSRMVRVLGAKIRDLINPSFLSRIDAADTMGTIEGMKLISDLPLEFLPTTGLPLALRYDTSRVAPVPGNLFMQVAAMPPKFLTVESFREVLVLRSFESHDTLRNLFESAVNVVSENQTRFKTKYRFLDVQTEADVVQALSDYEGAAVIFDCHGTYDNKLGMGNLVIGHEKLRFWQLKGRCSLPPIVMFSACDTQPIDGGHSSVATSAVGAVTVLATMLPIYGDRAALFNARMLFRLEEFLPVALTSRPLVTWREIVSGMLRMTHTTEIMDVLAKYTNLKLDKSQWSKAQLDANVAINSNDSEWYEQFILTLATVSSRTVDHIKSDISKWAGLTDAMKYVQLGNPENIIFKRDDLFP